MPSISSFSVEPSQCNSGAAVTLEVGVKKEGTLMFYFEGDNQPKFSNGTSRLDKDSSPILNDFNTIISGVKGHYTIYVQFTNESSDKRRSYPLNIK